MSFIRDTLENLRPVSMGRLSANLQSLLSAHLWAQVLLGFALGIAAGTALSMNVGGISVSLSASISEWVAFPGYLFLRLIQMIVIPLVFASIILGLASTEDLEQLKAIGMRIAIYFLFTTVVALVIGFFVASLIRPGEFIDSNMLAGFADASAPAVDISGQNTISLQEKVLAVLPQNPFVAISDSNMLQVVAFALIVGIALLSISLEQAKPIIALLSSVQEVCMTIVKWSMYLAPFAVFGLTTKMMATVGLAALAGLGAYVGSVILGLVCVFLFYMFLVVFVAKRNVSDFLKSIFSVQVLAFSTSSSASVMPLSIQTAEEKLKVRPSIAQFIVPLGSTINMDGTAVYQMIATMFLAQAYGIDLSTGQILLVGLSAVGASIGSPGTPGVGIVILASILTSVGIPVAGTALIIAVDRILDMLRTVINVSGDLTATVVMDRFSDKDK